MKSVLIMDAHPDIRLLLQMRLTRLFDIQVIEASSGNEAIDLIKKVKLDLVVSELDMVNGNGLLIHKFLKENVLILPLLFFTVFSEGAPPTDHVLKGVIDKSDFDKLIKVAQKIGGFNVAHQTHQIQSE